MSKKKFSFIKILCLGILILGIGCIAWSLTNILTQPKNQFNAECTASENEALDVEVIYEVHPEVGETFGSLTMPTLEQKFSIVQGTSDKELKMGVGHFVESALPGEDNNCVISGHRDTVFTKVGELQIGDSLIIETSVGIFTYEVTGTKIVEKDDDTIIVPTDTGKLTLTTCYPFRFLGDAPQRYIVIADLVKKEKPLVK